MEQVLDVYKRPYDPRFPVVCMDESPKQLLKEVRPPLPPTPGVLERYDYEYERFGMCNVFLACEPLVGRRLVEVRERKTSRDWAYFIQELEACYPEAERITLVQDTLNTHTLGSLYETFSAVEARRLSRRFEWIYTPKHGSWLNMAEIELSVLHRHCLNRRIGTLEEVAAEVRAWRAARDAKPAKIDWQFRTEDARIKLKRLYPTITV